MSNASLYSLHIRDSSLVKFSGYVYVFVCYVATLFKNLSAKATYFSSRVFQFLEWHFRNITNEYYFEVLKTDNIFVFDHTTSPKKLSGNKHFLDQLFRLIMTAEL